MGWLSNLADAAKQGMFSEGTTETHDIEGRQVRIVDNAVLSEDYAKERKDNLILKNVFMEEEEAQERVEKELHLHERLKKRAKKDILEICSTVDHAKIFPLLTFKLEFDVFQSVRESPAHIRTSEAKKGRFIVYVNVAWAFQRVRDKGASPKTAVSKMEKTIVHELGHAWHAYTSEWFNSFSQKSKRLREKLEELELDMHPKKAREKLANMFSLLHAEGIAEYLGEQHEASMPLTEEIFRNAHEESREIAASLYEKWGDFLAGDRKELKKVYQQHMRAAPYIIGPHMVHAILYLDGGNTRMEDILEMKDIAFVRKYAELMREAGEKPVVTFDGDGILDYKTMLAEWKSKSKVWEAIERRVEGAKRREDLT